MTGRRSAPGSTQRRYVPYSHAHYAGSLVDGAYGLGLFGDVATELCILTDGDEGLFASYDDVQFRAPVRAGDVVEATAELVRVGTRSRVMAFTLTVVARGAARPTSPAPPASSTRRWSRRRRPAPSSFPDTGSIGASPTTRRLAGRFCGISSSSDPALTCAFARPRRSADG